MRRGWQILRWGIVALWLVLLAWQVTPTTLRSLGHIPVGDNARVFAAHHNRQYRYSLYNHKAEEIGALQQSLGFRDAFLLLTTAIRVPDLQRLPGLYGLQAVGLDGAVSLDSTVELDDRKRPLTVTASGTVAGMRGKLEGHFDHQGLSGHYRLSGVAGGDFTIPELRIREATGLQIAMMLPPNLQAHSQFRQQVIGLQAQAPYVALTELVYQVGEQTTITTPGGEMTCMVVSLQDHGPENLRLWCDQQGVIYRAELMNSGLRLELTQISNEAGDELWPEHYQDQEQHSE